MVYWICTIDESLFLYVIIWATYAILVLKMIDNTKMIYV